MFLGSWHPVTSTVYDSTCMSLPSQHLDCTQAIRKINKERGKLWEFGCLDKEKICESFRCLNKSADSMSWHDKEHNATIAKTQLELKDLNLYHISLQNCDILFCQDINPIMITLK